MSEAGPAVARQVRALAGVGIGLLLLAAVTLFDAYRLAISTGVGVGPSASMKLIGAILALLGCAHLVAAWRTRAKSMPVQSIEQEPVNRAALAWVFGGLVGQIIVLMVGGGFILGSTILFIATARAFGKPLKSFAPVYGAILSTVVYLIFTMGLSLSLPSGPLEQLLLG
jgi:putative tricarboxylic transport membrane protein